MTRKFIATSLFLILICHAAQASTNEQSGYFLSWSQKMDLIGNGRMSDSIGNRYDVWICPGYVPPARYAKEHLKRAGSDFGDYFEAQKYRDLKEGSQSCFKWAFKECGWKFTMKGIPRAWGENFDSAHKRTQKRVFGWWMAYPWAFLESTVESAVRLAAGTVGTAGGAAAGLIVVPTFHVVNSGVAGTFELAVNTLTLPAVGMAWNTVVSPPLAFVGQKPAPSRVDGFWVTLIDGRTINRAGAYADTTYYDETSPLSKQDISLVSDYGIFLLNETRPYREKRNDLETTSAQKKDMLRRELTKVDQDARTGKTAIVEEEKLHIISVTATNELFRNVKYTSEDATAIRRSLSERNLQQPDVDESLRLLRIYRIPEFRAVSHSKTDPLRRTVEISTNVLDQVP